MFKRNVLQRDLKISFVLGLVLIALIGIAGYGKAAAIYSNAAIESKLANGIDTAVDWDTDCKAYLNANKGGGGLLRTIINNGASYHSQTWLSKAGVPNVASPTIVPYNTTSISLQINSVKFLCGSLVDNDLFGASPDEPASSAGAITASSENYRWVAPGLAHDRPPNAIGSTNMRPALVDTRTRIDSFTILSPTGGGQSITGGVGSELKLYRDNNSRYWFAAPVGVTYNNSAGIKDNTTLKIRMFYRTISGYHAASGPARDEACVKPDGSSLIAPSVAYSSCKQYSFDLTIIIKPDTSFDLNGAKIDSSGTNTTGNNTGYGGKCYSATAPGNCGSGTLASYQFSDDTVNVAIVGQPGTSIGPNTFYFNNLVGPIPSAPKNYRISIRDDPADSWVVKYYSICDNTTPGGCTSQKLTDTDGGFVKVPLVSGADPSIKYFDKNNFVPGRTYSMRWIYEPIVADACANIAGPQSSVPAGLTDDGTGNCYDCAGGTDPTVTCGGPIAGCPSLPNALIAVSLPDQSPSTTANPSGFSSTVVSTNGYTTYQRQNKTKVTSVNDISTGGSPRTIPWLNEAYQYTDLDYSPYVDDYPYDFNQARANYDSYYNRYGWSTETTKTYDPAAPWQDDDGDGVAEATDGNGVVNANEKWGYKWKTAPDSTALDQKVASSAVATLMEPCYDRRFELVPVAYDAAFNDVESPTQVTFRGQVNAGALTATDYSAIGLRDGLEITFPLNGVYYVEHEDGSTTPETPFSFGTQTISNGGSPALVHNFFNPIYPYSMGVSRPPLLYGDRMCFRAVLPSSAGTMNTTGGIQSTTASAESSEDPPTCTGRVGNKPYFRAYGGDIFAGGSFEAGGICASATNGRLIGQYRAATGAGAGGEIAAFALQDIVEVVSASTRSAFPTQINGLSFANTSMPAGNFATRNCVTDYYNTTQFNDGDPLKDPFGGGAINLDTPPFASGEQTDWTPTGNARINSAVVNKRHTVYVDGDAFITGNLTYPGGAITDFKTTPYLAVVVLGDIFISKDVTQLDGLYIAQPRPDGTGGRILTCRDNNDGGQIDSASMVADCNQKLTVNGAFIARQVYLQRTNGTLSTVQGAPYEPASSGNIAEVFQHSPEFYFGRPVFKTTTGLYDSIRALPPVL